MKRIHKILIILAIIAIALIFLSNTASAPGNGGVEVTTETINMDGVTYRVFKGKAAWDNHIDIEVVNVTKEKLEMERLRAEIKYYKSLH